MNIKPRKRLTPEQRNRLAAMAAEGMTLAECLASGEFPTYTRDTLRMAGWRAGIRFKRNRVPHGQWYDASPEEIAAACAEIRARREQECVA